MPCCAKIMVDIKVINKREYPIYIFRNDYSGDGLGDFYAIFDYYGEKKSFELMNLAFLSIKIEPLDTLSFAVGTKDYSLEHIFKSKNKLEELEYITSRLEVYYIPNEERIKQDSIFNNVYYLSKCKIKKPDSLYVILFNDWYYK